MVDSSGVDRDGMAELAVEYWKLLMNYDRLVVVAPEAQQAGLVAQARFGARRLAAILDRSGLRIVSFDGEPYSSGLPVIAINADDFADAEIAIVEQTLEPAVIAGTTPVRTGRVYLRAVKPAGH